MAQHIPIEQFKQKAMRQIEKSIRADRYFYTSMKYNQLAKCFNDNYGDVAFVTERAIPKSIGLERGWFEVHTEIATIGRKATNIYLVI